MTVIDVFYFVTIQPTTVEFGKSQNHEAARCVEVSEPDSSEHLS